VRHHRPDAYSAEQVLLNKRQIYGGAPKLHWYRRKKGLTSAFSVRQGRWVYLLLDRLGFSVTCTLVTLEVLTGLIGQFADKPTRGQSSRGLVNSPIAKCFKSQKDYTTYLCTQNLNLTLTLW